MDLAGVRRIVIVPPSWEGDRNELALEAARLYPDRFAVMGRIAGVPPRRGQTLTLTYLPGAAGMPSGSRNGKSQSLTPDLKGQS